MQSFGDQSTGVPLVHFAGADDDGSATSAERDMDASGPAADEEKQPKSAIGRPFTFSASALEAAGIR